MTRSDSPMRWQQEMTARVGAAVQAVRKERGMSGDALVAALAARGVDLSRNVLASLETGRRPYVTVAELFALALVLDTAPARLLFPDPTADVRLLPRGDELPAHGVLDWIVGGPSDVVPDALLSESTPAAEARYRESSAPLRAARDHHDLVIDVMLGDADRSDPDASDVVFDRFRRAVRRLAEFRRHMADQGWTLPDLPGDGDVERALDAYGAGALS